MGFKDSYRKQIAERCKNDLADHVVTQLHDDDCKFRVWRCRRSNSWTYGFVVYAPPGWLMMTGDMGECMWSRTYDMIDFARGAIKSLEYFSEKASKDCKIKEHYGELVEEWFSEVESEYLKSHGDPMSDEKLETLGDLRDMWESSNDHQELRNAIYCDLCSGDCESVPSFEYYSYQYLWKVEALKWFIAKLNAGDFVKGGL